MSNVKWVVMPVWKDKPENAPRDRRWVMEMKGVQKTKSEPKRWIMKKRAPSHRWIVQPKPQPTPLLDRIERSASDECATRQQADQMHGVLPVERNKHGRAGAVEFDLGDGTPRRFDNGDSNVHKVDANVSYRDVVLGPTTVPDGRRRLI